MKLKAIFLVPPTLTDLTVSRFVLANSGFLLHPWGYNSEYFFEEKVWLYRYIPKRPSKGIFRLCVVTVLQQIKWTNYSTAISVSLGRTLTVFWHPIATVLHCL